MTDVAVLILHPEPAARAGELERWVATARASIAKRHRLGFLAAGATDVTVSAGLPDGVSFGERLRSFVLSRRPAGLVVLGSGAIPLATAGDRRAFVATAGSGEGRVALVNNRYSADVLAIAVATGLAELPDMTTDNGLPRWLADSAGYEVTDLRRRWRLRGGGPRRHPHRGRGGSVRRHASPAGPPPGSRRSRLAHSGGPIRVGPAAPRADRGSVAARPDAIRRRGPDPGGPRRSHARRARASTGHRPTGLGSGRGYLARPAAHPPARSRVRREPARPGRPGRCRGRPGCAADVPPLDGARPVRRKTRR